jgi:hypothetical protein
MQISIEVQHFDGMFLELNSIVSRNKPVYEERIKQILESTAKDEHRYKSKTGKLKGATKAVADLNKSIRLYVDQSKAPYAKYVVNRRGTWDGDNFIEEAMEKNKEEITAIIKDLYNDSIQEWNNR